MRKLRKLTCSTYKKPAPSSGNLSKPGFVFSVLFAALLLRSRRHVGPGFGMHMCKSPSVATQATKKYTAVTENLAVRLEVLAC